MWPIFFTSSPMVSEHSSFIVGLFVVFLFFSLWWLNVGCSAPLGRERILFLFSLQTREELISIVVHCSTHLHKAAVWPSQIITQSELNRRPAPSFQWAPVPSHLPERTPLFWSDRLKWMINKTIKSCSEDRDKTIDILKRFKVWTFVFEVSEFIFICMKCVRASNRCYVFFFVFFYFVFPGFTDPPYVL